MPKFFACRPRLLRPAAIKAYNRTIVKQSILDFERSYPKGESRSKSERLSAVALCAPLIETLNATFRAGFVAVKRSHLARLPELTRIPAVLLPNLNFCVAQFSAVEASAPATRRAPASSRAFLRSA
jgi:hypothetical protein